MPKVYAAESSDMIDGDTFFSYGPDRLAAENKARRLSAKLSEKVAYVVAFNGSDHDNNRCGHRVFIAGRVDRTEGNYC